MMGLDKMAPDGWRYCAEEVGLGREDYFAGHGEEPGRWLGRGGQALGLAGEVTPEQMAKLFGEGRHPETGVALGRPFGAQRGLTGDAEKGKERQGAGRPGGRLRPQFFAAQERFAAVGTCRQSRLGRGAGGP